LSEFSDDMNPLLNSLSDERVGIFFQTLIHLSHYNYAMLRLREVSDEEALSFRGSMSSPHIFYIESLYTMLANWFSVSSRKRGSQILKGALTTLGLDSELEAIDHHLDSSIGDTTFRDLLREFRNAQTTHDIFTGDAQTKLAEKHSLNPVEIVGAMRNVLDEMHERIVELRERIEVQFEEEHPQLYALMSSSHMFISVRT